eukprot:241983_1
MSFGNVIDSGNNSQAIDLQEVNHLFAQIEMNERKQPSEGDNPTHSNTTKRRTISGSVPYHSPQFHPQMVPSMSNHNTHNPNQKQSIPTKIYCIAGYRILVHLLLLYCVIGVTYLWFIKNHMNCECPQFVTESSTSFDTPSPIINQQPNPTPNPTTNTPLNMSNNYFNDKLDSLNVRIMDAQSDVNIMKINFTDYVETLSDIQQILNECECSNHPKFDDKIFNITDKVNSLSAPSIVQGFPDVIICNGDASYLNSGTSFWTLHWCSWSGDCNYRFSRDQHSAWNLTYYADGSFKHYTQMTAYPDCDGKSIAQLYEAGQAFNFAVKPFSVLSQTALPTGNPIPSPTYYATTSPTDNPTPSPTYQHYVGDYKISAQNASHGYWKLCDGSFLDSVDYPELFDVIGQSFGSFSGYPSLFALSDARDRVVGISGSNHHIGTEIGREAVVLNTNQLPSHAHFVMWDGVGLYDVESVNPMQGNHFARECPYPQNIFFSSTNNIPNILSSSSVGSANNVSVMQPTNYVGNLFIYSGR